MELQEPKIKLRRQVTVWGSFCWGYADVGADVYVALGLVIAAAQGATPLAFAVAGIVYVFVGLAHTELAAAYPVAGGGQYFAFRGMGDFWGIVTGAALMLDYTVDIALFAMASAGYVNFFFPVIREFAVDLGPFKNVNLIWLGESMFFIACLTVLNIRGIRESSMFNEVLGVLDMAMEASIVVLGFAFAWRPDLFLHQWNTAFPPVKQILYAVSIAVISFVGLESVSQAAQETIRPGAVIPRTSLALIVVVLLFAMAFPIVSLGILPWQDLASREGDPVAHLASQLPYVGVLAGPIAAVLAATIVLISANTGVMGCSRLAYSMSEMGLIGGWLSHLHPKYHTPIRAILVFAGVAAVEAIFGFMTGQKALETMADMYAFGAMLAYLLASMALIALRIREPRTPRAYRVPFNVHWRGMDIPVLGLLAVLGTAGMVGIVLWTHHVARILGPLWILGWIGYYIWYRFKLRLPIFRSTKRDWDGDQLKILADTGEWELYEQFKIEVERKKRSKTPETKTTAT
jgi:APA family basic amino acid/polyamine antiporter